jgi:hypothetical protein
MVDDLESSSTWGAACPNQFTSHDETRHYPPLACQDVFSCWIESVKAFVSSVVHRLCYQGMYGIYRAVDLGQTKTLRPSGAHPEFFTGGC